MKLIYLSKSMQEIVSWSSPTWCFWTNWLMLGHFDSETMDIFLLYNVKKVEFTTRVDTLISRLLAIKLPITFDLRNRQILKVHYNFGTQSYSLEFTFYKGLKPSIVLSISCCDTIQGYNCTDRNIVTNDWCRTIPENPCAGADNILMM